MNKKAQLCLIDYPTLLWDIDDSTTVRDALKHLLHYGGEVLIFFGPGNQR